MNKLGWVHGALLAAVGLASVAAMAEQPGGFVNTLMPLPVKVESGAGSLKIESALRYAVTGKAGGLAQAATVRFLKRLQMRTGVELLLDPAQAGTDAGLTIDVATATVGAVPKLGVDESYTLDVDAHHAALKAQTEVGALRGLETLLQLVQVDGSGFVFPAVHVEDAPRFPWRGLMLDPGRHFLPLDVIYRTLDGMAAVKLNVLHWHLSEDQGFRIESKVYPKLNGMGSNGLFYTQEQAKAVVAYAAARAIRVMPEFDMPGHATSWMVGYPELGSAPGPYEVAHVFGVHDAALNPINEGTYKFLDGFLGEMAALFPDEYMHVGGDESNGKQWKANKQIKAYMDAHGMKTTAELQAYFNTRVEKILTRHHKKMAGWDEVLNPKLPADVAIQVWHQNSFLVNAAKQGHLGFYSQAYYLDHMKTAEQMYLADPIPDGADLTPEQLKLILGGEVCMWGEQLAPWTADSRIWPRTAAIAERFWSPAADRDVDDMYRRLDVESLRLEAEGLMHMSGPVRGLRQIAGTTHVQALEVFAGTLQPVDFGTRYNEQHTSQLTVMDRLVDALRPDPPLRHEMALLADAASKGDAAALKRLDSIFHSWADAEPGLEKLAAGSPVLQEEPNRLREFPKLAEMGIEAVGYLQSGNVAPAGWKAAQQALLSEAGKSQELVNFVVVAPLGKLVGAVKEGDAIASYLGPLVENHTIAGAVTLVASKDGTVYRKAVGYRDIEAKAAMPENAMFWIASVSKPLTVTAFMMLVDEGKVSLNDPVEKYLPEFKGQMVKGADGKLVAARHPILVREILSHTSGLAFSSKAQPGALDLLPLKEQVKSFAAEPLLFQPDTDYKYSNEGIDTAARIIEVVSGEPYEQFTQERLFDPLGMKDTTFWPNAEQIARLAESYKLDEKAGALVKMPVSQLTYPLDDHTRRFPMPAGGLFSTADDLGKFGRMLLNGGTLDGKRYISEAALRDMTSRQNHGLEKTDYGFGMTVAKTGFGHGGAYKNSLDIDTATGRVLIFMVQQSGPWGTKDGDAMIPRLKTMADEMVTPASR